MTPAPPPAPVTSTAPPASSPVVAPAAEPAPSYEALAIKAEAGEPVDLRELRMAYLRSATFRSGARDGGEAVRARTGEMFKAMRSKDHAKVFALAQQTIAEFYLDLRAHKARYQSCEILKRPDCAKYKAVSLGLLRSIVHGRDGKTCATGWEVVRVAEEYFVADMLGLNVRRQRLVHDGRVCDALDVEDEQSVPSTIYFDVDAMLSATELAARGSGQ